MSPLIRINWALAVLVLILGLIAWLRPGSNAESLPLLTSLDPANIQVVEIGQGGELKARFVRDEGHWRMEVPRTTESLNDKLEQLLQITTLPSLHRFPVPADRLREFGLNGSGIRLRLGDQLLEFGNIDPVTRARYVRSGPTIHLVPDSRYHLLLAPPQAFAN